MNKDIHPLVALLIVTLFCIPLVLLFWATGHLAESRVSTFFLQTDADQRLAIQMDDQLILRADSPTPVSFDLRSVGAQTPMGNVDFFSNGDFVVRYGKVDYNWREYLSLFEYRRPSDEFTRHFLVKDKVAREGLVRCRVEDASCQSIGNITTPWRYRLFIDRHDDTFFVTEGTQHRLTRYDEHGNVLDTIATGLKFPKRVRPFKGQLYVVDTNHQQLVFLDKQGDNWGQQLSPQRVVPANETNHRWTLDVLFFNDHWWVINVRTGMTDGQLLRFDSDWNNATAIHLPEGADPFDMLVHNDMLWVSDIRRGVIYRINEYNEMEDQWRSPAIDHYVTSIAQQHNYYQRIKFGALIAFLVLLIAGFTLATLIGNRHDRQQQLLQPKTSPQRVRGLNIKGTTMLISNIEMVPGKRIVEHLGLVQGSTVRAKHAGKDILASFKNLFGGELSSYTELLQESRQEALDRMGEQAKAIGANAVINVRFATSSIAAGASEILAYGTAVKLEDR